ncbi:MAG: hypothetical protein KDA96_15650, partial [Planctomycetaceae bacterium]|nr:hypothetical protein [Planctomycetaceae bacterium]
MAVRIPRRFVFLLLFLAGLVGLGVWRHFEQGLEQGQRLIQKRDWDAAEVQLNNYLMLHPHDPEALLAKAELLIRRPRGDAKSAAETAVQLLDQIPDGLPLSAVARTQSARIRLLILRQVWHAETDLMSAIRQDPESLDANYMMWKVLDLTRRYHLVEPFFQVVYRHASPDQKLTYLTEWYLSQFSTFAASVQLDQMMGVTKPGAASDALSEYKRLIGFSQLDPNCPMLSSALAGWCKEYHFTEEKWKWFDKTWENADPTTPSSAYATLFDIVIEDGRFDEAKEIYQSWPEPRSGYDFWKREGIYFSEVVTDLPRAVQACRNAIGEWPGPVDWQLRHRMAGLLVRMGKLQEAEDVRAAAHRFEKLMEVKLHSDLRSALAGERGADGLESLAQFYRDIERPMEADGWQELADRRHEEVPKLISPGLGEFLPSPAP